MTITIEDLSKIRVGQLLVSDDGSAYRVLSRQENVIHAFDPEGDDSISIVWHLDDGSLNVIGARPVRKLLADKAHVADAVFTPEQACALCGWKFPYADGFTWSEAERFELIGDCLEPYSAGDVLPGPSIRIAATAVLES